MEEEKKRSSKYSEYCCDDFGRAHHLDFIEWDVVDVPKNWQAWVFQDFDASDYIHFCPWCGQKLEAK